MHTVPLTTGVPALASRMRLPRHHHAQRDQAIADALELVRRLEGLMEGTQIAQPLDEGYAEVRTPQGVHSVDAPTRSASTPASIRTMSPRNGRECCRCEWGGYWRPTDPAKEIEEHDRLLARLTTSDPWELADLLEVAITWEEMYDDGDGGIPPWCWPRFVSQHNFPDPTAAQKLVNAIRQARLGMRAWHAATNEQRAEWDQNEDV